MSEINSQMTRSEKAKVYARQRYLKIREMMIKNGMMHVDENGNSQRGPTPWVNTPEAEVARLRMRKYRAEKKEKKAAAAQ